MMRPVFGDRRQLAEITGVQVSGSWKTGMDGCARARKKRWDHFLFAVALLVLFSAFAAVLLVFYFHVDVMSKLSL